MVRQGGGPLSLGACGQEIMLVTILTILGWKLFSSLGGNSRGGCVEHMFQLRQTAPWWCSSWIGIRSRSLDRLVRGCHSLVPDVKHFSDGSPHFRLWQHWGGLHLLSSSRESLSPEMLHRMVSRHRIASHLFDLWGIRLVDLFTSRLNNKVETFFSRLPDPLTCQATPCRWIGLQVFTRWRPRGLHKVIREEAQVIAILLRWHRRGWFPLVLQFLVNLPVLLPGVYAAWTQLSRLKTLGRSLRRHGISK